MRRSVAVDKISLVNRAIAAGLGVALVVAVWGNACKGQAAAGAAGKQQSPLGAADWGPKLAEMDAIAHWTLDQNGGNAVGNRLSGNLIGQPQFERGRVNQALSLNGRDQYFLVPHDGAFDMGRGDFSIALWVRLNGNAASNPIASKGGYNWKKGWVLDVGANGKRGAVRLETSGGGERSPGSSQISTNVNVLSSGEWHHIAVSVEKSVGGSQTRIYVDGVAEATGHIDQVSLDNSDADLCIGRIDQYRLSGSVDDVWFFRRAISEADVRSLIGGNRPRFPGVGAPHPHNPGAPPSDKSKKRAESSVDLRGHAPPVGLTFRQITRFRILMTETARGGAVSVTTETARTEEHVHTVKAVYDDSVSGYVTKVLRGEDVRRIVDSSGRIRTEQRVDDLAGAVIVSEMLGAHWQRSLSGKAPYTAEGQAITRFRPFFECRDDLPAGKQKVGVTWEVDSAQIKERFGGSLTAVSGTLRVGFLRLEKHEGDLCAVIEYKGVIKGREELQDAGGEVRTIGIDQVAYVSLRYGLSIKTSGLITVESVGKRKTDRGEVDVTTRGQITVTSTTTISR